MIVIFFVLYCIFSANGQNKIPLLLEQASSLKSQKTVESDDENYCTKVNPRVIKGNQIQIGDTLLIHLFDLDIQGIVDKITTNVNNTKTIRCRLLKYPMGHVILSSTQNDCFGIIDIPEIQKRYSINSLDLNNPATVKKLNYKIEDPIGCSKNAQSCSCCSEGTTKSAFLDRKYHFEDIGDSIVNVDIMVLYTPESFRYINERSIGIESAIANQVEYLNLCLENSMTFTRFTLVYSAQTNYTVTRSATEFMDILSRLQMDNDGYMDEIHDLRNYYGADIVSLIAEIQGVGGVSSGVNGGRDGNAELGAFNICGNDNVIYSNSVLAHETGHNFGAGHNRYQLDNPGPNYWGNYWPENNWSSAWNWPCNGTPHGRIEGAEYNYITVMAYERLPNDVLGVEVPYFSNPEVYHNNYPTGDVLLADNARTIREMRQVIAGYRESKEYPEISTGWVYGIKDVSAECDVTIKFKGNSLVLSCGVCWDTIANPDINDCITTDGAGAGTFVSQIVGLAPRTTYYVRSYVTTSEGVNYGNQRVFTTHSIGYVEDYDHNTYDTIHIGNQVWLKQNLNVTHYNNGTKIPMLEDMDQWSDAEYGACCNYDNDSAYAYKFGRLYNWYSVNEEKGLCPSGWKVPDNEDWDELFGFLGNDSIAATKLLNEDGFNALYAGYREKWSLNYPFGELGSRGYWWTKTESEAIKGLSLFSYFGEMRFIYRTFNNRNFGLSVRCMLGDPPVANAGSDQTVSSGIMAILDGSSSYDPEGNSLSFSWSIPSIVKANTTNFQTLVFSAPLVHSDTTLVFTLTVNDGLENSVPDTVLVTVKRPTVQHFTLEVKQPEELSIKAAKNDFSILEGEQVVFDVEELDITGGTGDYLIAWKNEAWQHDSITSVIDLQPTDTTQLIVEVTDKNGCSAVDFITVNVVFPMEVNATVNNVSCYGKQNGSISLDIQKGSPPYCFEWSNGKSASEITNLTTGTYQVNIFDAKEQNYQESFEITEPEMMGANISAALCEGNSYFFGNKNYYTEGVYTDTLRSTSGCDSIVHLSLNVNPIPETPVISVNGDTLISSEAESYQWYKNDEILIGQTKQQLVITETDNYKVEVANEFGCTSQSENYNVIYTAIAEFSSPEFNIKVFPNPNNGMFIVEIDTDQNEQVLLELFSVDGNSIIRKQIDERKSKQSILFGIENLAKGVYTIRVQCGMKTINQKLIVK